MPLTSAEFLRQFTLTNELVDRFLDPDAANWAEFDPELGYMHRSNFMKDGVDGSYTISRFSGTGERRLLNFADMPCRINTYGDSFTECNQVSDGETWQEYLAAHLGEPIRNFGVGGYGVYQAYLRMVREESKATSEDNVILNIWSDDHVRSIYKWRWLHIGKNWRSVVRKGLPGRDASMFHVNPWAHVRLSVENGQFEERPNPYRTPSSLYQLCDEDHVVDSFRNDFEVQALFATNGVTDVNIRVLRDVAGTLDIPGDFTTPEATSLTASELLENCALRSTFFVLKKAQEFATSEGRQLMILLSYSSDQVTNAIRGDTRFDQELVRFLKDNKIAYVDSLQKHVEDYASFGCSPQEYVDRYYIGHYNPRGNHFFAFAIKDEIVDWLEPKPPAYYSGPSPTLDALANTLT